MKYIFDEMGNRFEGMTKEEILETIGSPQVREDVFTGHVVYEGEEIPYEYNGTKPSDELIVKLIDCGANFDNNLAPTEVAQLLGLNEFKLKIYACEAEIYITNGHCNVINIFNEKIGYREIYTNANKKEYYIKSSKLISDIYYCTASEFEDIVRDPNQMYVVETLDYVVPEALHATNADTATNANRADFAPRANKIDVNNSKANYTILDYTNQGTTRTPYGTTVGNQKKLCVQVYLGIDIEAGDGTVVNLPKNLSVFITDTGIGPNVIYETITGVFYIPYGEGQLNEARFSFWVIFSLASGRLTIETEYETFRVTIGGLNNAIVKVENIVITEGN